ncbi:MAG: BMP family ABC transporter substrate-binding protein [Anaerolineales bacterium]|nr:BMP family ABC transporter substrate-binding protein [Anaerolineales bacterium]
MILTLQLVAGCAAPAATPAASAPATDAGAAPAAATPLKVLNFVNGSLGDKSFFDSAQRGIEMARQELGIDAQTIEVAYDSTQYEPALVDALANNDFDVVVLGTSDMVPYVEKLAPEYPDVKFVFYDDVVNPANCSNQCANVYSMTYKQNEGSYLAGVYAAAMTTQALDGMNPEAVIGSVGGQEIPIILDFMLGYEQGARDTNPDIQAIRQFANSWDDPAKGKELAKAQYSQGADIVFQIAGGTGQGVFEAAVEDGKFAIGVDSDQALAVKDADPKQAERILTSMLKNVDKSVLRALKMTQDGTLPYGTAEALGIAEDGVGLARNEIYDAATPDEVKAQVDAAEQKIIAGEITVQTAFQ